MPYGHKLSYTGTNLGGKLDIKCSVYKRLLHRGNCIVPHGKIPWGGAPTFMAFDPKFLTNFYRMTLW